MKSRSELEILFAAQLEQAGFLFIPEYKFWPGRKFKFDFADPIRKIALEVEGGTWSGGRHTRGTGFESDCEKYNEATIRGWRVLRFTSSMINDPELRALRTVQRIMETENV